MRSVPTATRAAGASEQRSSALGLVAAPPHGELVDQARGSASPHIVAPASALAPRLAGDGDRRSGGRGRGSPREENARADERVERASLAAPVLVPRWWLVAGAAHGTTAGAELDTVGDAADAMGVAVQSTRGDSECEEEETCDAAFLLRHSMLPRIFQTPPLPATGAHRRPCQSSLSAAPHARPSQHAAPRRRGSRAAG
ncbi:hypothetical protein KFE25_009858 [Diacronema lutheri]|uniref:Uncharacterized protein n=1 Tax=Diacronema lutheri TaxID=2081491 RepID=A0A8J5X0Z3_DIALT|nr:hypothetical protein KFE25_009858 [Diacronema lutheri]